MIEASIAYHRKIDETDLTQNFSRRNRRGRSSRKTTIMTALPKSFTARLVRRPSIGGWTYVIWPQSAKVFGTRGLVKIAGKIDGHPFRASFMAMGDGQHMLPIKAETRKAIGKDVGETVHILGAASGCDPLMVRRNPRAGPTGRHPRAVH